MHYFPHTFFIVTANMLLTNIANLSMFVFIAVYVIIHERTFGPLSREVHFSTVRRAFAVGVIRTGPGILIRCNLNTVIAYPCPFPRALSQANEIINPLFRLKFLLQKIHFIFILNRNKLAAAQRAQMEAFIPSCCLLSTGWFMNSVTRTTEFKCQILNEIKQSVSKHLKLIIYPPGISIDYTVKSRFIFEP